MDNELDVILDNAGVKEDYPDFKDPNKIHSPRAELKSQILAYVDKRERLVVAKRFKSFLLAFSGEMSFEAKDSMRFQIRELEALTNSKVTEGE